MAATKFEFERRFWIFGAIFWLGFTLYSADHTNSAIALIHFYDSSIDPGGRRGIFLARMVFSFAAMLIFLAAFLRTWATSYLHVEVVHDPRQHTEALLADGPYRYVRNPLYFANLMMAAGMGLLASRLGWIVMFAGMSLFVYRLILREEQGLLDTQGRAYADYMKKVPRLWPSLSPCVPSTGNRSRWGQAVAAETFFWLVGASVLCFALTLSMLAMGIVLAVGFTFYFIVIPAIRKRARQ
jgi:protein-S-isoprenylcysteine O-methyltransferase Ste14